MKKVYGVYKQYCEDEPELIALYNRDIKAVERAISEFEKNETRIMIMKDVEKGSAKIFKKDYLEVEFEYGGVLLNHKVKIKYFIKEMEVL